MRVERAARRDTELTEAISAEILNAGQKSRLRHAQIHPLTSSKRPCFEFLARDCPEAQAIARSQKGGRIFLRLEKPQRRTTNHIPTAGRAQRVNAALRCPDRNRPGTDFFSWRSTARRCEFFWKTDEIWKPRGEADTAHMIISHAVKIDDFLRRHLCA